MPRKKRHSKHRRRHRVGAFGIKKSDTNIKLLSIAGGFLLGKTINEQIDKIVEKAMPATTSTATATTKPDTHEGLKTSISVGVGGLLLLKKKTGNTGMYLNIAGGLLAGAGIRRMLGTMGFLNGYQSVPVIGRPRMAGYQSVPVIGQRVTPPQLSGTPAQLQGFRVNGYTPTGSGVMGKIGAIDGGSGITNCNGGGYMG